MDNPRIDEFLVDMLTLINKYKYNDVYSLAATATLIVSLAEEFELTPDEFKIYLDQIEALYLRTIKNSCSGIICPSA